MIKEINDKEFDSVIKQPLVVVDFWASWCMPCVAIAPIIEEVSKKFKNIEFVKINIGENKEKADKFNILSVPTFLFFKKGKLIDEITGALPKDEFEKKLKEFSK